MTSSEAEARSPNRHSTVAVNALFGSDALTQLVLLLGSDTIARAAEKVAYHSVGRRIAPREAALVLRYQGRVVPPALTVEEAGIEPLGFVYVEFAEAEA